MGRIIALDLGKKRCGVAVTDPLQIIANGLATVPTHELEGFLVQYIESEDVERFVIGNPLQLNGEPSESQRYIVPIINKLKKKFPQIPCEYTDERFTSTLAHRAMIEGGMKKSHRRIKENADIMAATILLNDYLESKKFRIE